MIAEIVRRWASWEESTQKGTLQEPYLQFVGVSQEAQVLWRAKTLTESRL